MRPLRRLLATEIYFVTIRTVEQRFALDPHASPGAWREAEARYIAESAKWDMIARGRACVDATVALTDAIARSEGDEKCGRPDVPYSTFTDSIPNIIGSCMARAIEMFGVHLYGAVWMSNHGHLLLRAPRGNLAEFMAYLNGQIAVKVNRFLGRTDHLWSRRYSASQVLDEAAELEILGYILANPQRAGIAASIEEWPGLSSASFFFRNHKQRFLQFDRTAWYNNGRPDDIAPFLSTVELEHTLLPQLSILGKKKRRRTLRRQIKKQLKSLASVDVKRANLQPDRPFRRRPLAPVVIPTDRPESSIRCTRKRSPQPLCHTTSASLRKLYREWYREFRCAYAVCSRKYRQGEIDVEFPTGSFAPSRYPRARYSKTPDAVAKLHPTRKNLEIANARLPLA